LPSYVGFPHNYPPGLLEEFRLSCHVGLRYCLSYFVNQVAGVLEIAIDAGETNIRHFINITKMFYNAFADEGAGDLFIEVFENVLFDLVGNLANLLGGDRPFIACFLKADYNFFPVIRDARAVFFDDVHSEALTGFFVCGETLVARQALASAPDDSPAVAGARVDYFILFFFAEGTSHGLIPPRFQKNGSQVAYTVTSSSCIVKALR
jgi:hypothetical protein